MTRASEHLRRIIRRELRPRVTSAADAKAGAAAAVETYEQLARQLTRLIGEAGVSAIHTRSVHLTRKEFPWLAAAPPAEGSRVLVQHLRTTLEGQQPAVILLSSEALVVNLIDLLVTLIGERLTTRLLQEAWPDAVTTETAQETTE
jgi:hypothetical protein